MIENLCFLIRYVEKTLTTIFKIMHSWFHFLIISFNIFLRFRSVTNDLSNYIIQYFPSKLCSNFFKNSDLKSIYLHKLYIIFYELIVYFIYIQLWCKSSWLAGVACVSAAYVVSNPVITQVILQRPPSDFVKIVFDQITSQVLWKTPRVLKECRHFYSHPKTLSKVKYSPSHKNNFMKLR
jgi:hypothetical protein